MERKKPEGPLGGYIYLPGNIEKGGMPMTVYLHGAGERGAHPEHLARHAVPRLIEEGREYNAAVLSLQCPAEFVWGNIVEKVREAIEANALKYAIDKSRISITGSSMGGFGAVDMVMYMRNYFSAAAIVSGGGMSFRAPNLKGTPVRFYHGEKDGLVHQEESKLLYDAAKSCGCECTYTVLPGMGHNDAIEYVYENTDIMEWLISAKRTDFTYIPEFLEDLF